MSWGLRSDCKHLSVDVVAATQKGRYGGQLDTFTERAAQYPNDREQNVSLVWVGKLADKIRLINGAVGSDFVCQLTPHASLNFHNALLGKSRM